MSRFAIAGAFALIVLGAVAGGAEERSGTCQLTSMAEHVLAPVDLGFSVAVGSATAHVTVDPASGKLTFDGSSLTIAPYDIPFSEARDTIDFVDQVFEGTIDGSGTVILPGVKFNICTGGSPAGTDCVPTNLCSNDVSRICIRDPRGDIGCLDGGVCQGVCSNDRSQTCAGDADCPGGVCGNGTLVPFVVDLSTGLSILGDLIVHGAPLDFATHALTLTNIAPTPAESPIVGNGGISSIIISCVLDVPLDASELPAFTTLAVKKGQVHLGKGDASAGDDALVLKAVFRIPKGLDLATQDLNLTLGTPADTVVSFRIPAGALKPNRKKTLFSLVDKSGQVIVRPASAHGATTVHRITIARRKSVEYVITLNSKGLNLDGLMGDHVVTAAVAGFQSASTTSAARTKTRSVVFH